MNLTTEYLGLTLRNPIVVGASPLSDDLDMVKRLEDAGAAAIVLRSLFEEQITNEQAADAGSAFPSPHAFALKPDRYLEHLRKVKHAVRIPVFASLNGTTDGGWIEYARLMAEAGADALELNLYRIATNADIDGASLERAAVNTVRSVRESVTVPVAAKLSPFYTAFAHTARELDRAYVDGLVLFNRFYQPDIDVEDVSATRSILLSDPSELPLRLHWIALLSGRVRASLAVTGGVHTARDVVKATMAGAHVTQMVSAPLMHGPEHVRTVLTDLEAWLSDNEWPSLSAMRGTLNFSKVPDPDAYERANYMLMLQGWRGTERPR